jgi:hypothetical protein
MEVSRLGFYVRINNNASPNFLEAYHSHIYSFLVPVSVIVTDTKWSRIENRWMKAKQDIDLFYRARRAVPNKKIPFELVRELDNLYRIALLMAQKAGLGVRTFKDEDVDVAIEKAIMGGN